MAYPNPLSRPGLRQGGTDSRELLETIFTGEVLTAFDTAVKFRDKQRVRLLDHGKAVQFPAMFKVGTKYHTPGTAVQTDEVPANDITISIDDVLTSAVFVADVDEIMGEYELRAPYSNEIGNALALAYDRNVVRNIIKAARGPALFTGGFGGSSLTSAAYETDGAALLDGIGAARQTLDEKDVPVDMMAVHAALKPAQWYLVAATDKNLNRDYAGDGKAVNQDVLRPVYDVGIVKSNAAPFGVDESLAPDVPTKYQGNWANTVGTVWTDAAVATAQLRGMSMQTEDSVKYQGTLLVGKYLVGHGTLRNECAVELKKA